MTGKSFILPTGTSRTDIVNLPIAGGWLGATRVGMACKTPVTIHELVFIWPNAPGGKTWFRRVNMDDTGGTNWYNGQLQKENVKYNWLFHNESLMRITYTATVPISFSLETSRGIGPLRYDTLSLAQWNISSSTPWTGAGNNLTPGNPTERTLDADLDGRIYWKPTL